MKDMIPDLLLLLQQLIYVLMTMLRQMSPNRLNQHREKGRCLASMPWQVFVLLKVHGVTNGIALLCSSMHQPHFVVDLKSFFVQEV